MTSDSNNSNICAESDEDYAQRIKSNSLQPGDIYQHYKSPESLYRIVFTALDEASKRPVVVYQSVRNPRLIWVRDYQVWNEQVDGQQRFTLVRRSNLGLISSVGQYLSNLFQNNIVSRMFGR